MGLSLLVTFENIWSKQQFSILFLAGAFYGLSARTYELRRASRGPAFASFVCLRRRAPAPVPGISSGAIGPKYEPSVGNSADPCDCVAVRACELRRTARGLAFAGLEGFWGRAEARSALRGELATSALPDLGSFRAARGSRISIGTASHEKQQTKQYSHYFHVFPSSRYLLNG